MLLKQPTQLIEALPRLSSEVLLSVAFPRAKCRGAH
jgi:hypothetical protein